AASPSLSTPILARLGSEVTPGTLCCAPVKGCGPGRAASRTSASTSSTAGAAGGASRRRSRRSGVPTGTPSSRPNLTLSTSPACCARSSDTSERVYSNGGESDTQTYSDCLALAHAEGAEVLTVQRGDNIPLGGRSLHVFDAAHARGTTGPQ